MDGGATHKKEIHLSPAAGHRTSREAGGGVSSELASLRL